MLPGTFEDKRLRLTCPDMSLRKSASSAAVTYPLPAHRKMSHLKSKWPSLLQNVFKQNSGCQAMAETHAPWRQHAIRPLIFISLNKVSTENSQTNNSRLKGNSTIYLKPCWAGQPFQFVQGLRKSIPRPRLVGCTAYTHKEGLFLPIPIHDDLLPFLWSWGVIQNHLQVRRLNHDAKKKPFMNPFICP